MESQKIPILLNCLAAFLGAVGQYYYKRGSALLHERIFNLPILIGIVLFCLVMALFVVSYKLGGRISVVYPFYATTFVWGTLIGSMIEKEKVSPVQFAGLGLILCGLTLIATQARIN